MEGAAERERRQVERIVAQAWWNENLERRRVEAEAAQTLSRPC
jgi:hypothetical protein